MSFIEYTEISLKMIVESGLITPGTVIYSSSEPQATAKINADGSVSLYINGSLKTYAYPSGAARAVTKLSVNGWTFWKIAVENEYKELAFLREQFVRLKKNGK